MMPRTPSSTVSSRAARLVALVAALFVLAPAGTAAAGVIDQIHDDCQDGRIDRSYSTKDLREAFDQMPGDLAEYTNCGEIIRAAAQGVRGGGGSGPGGAGEGGYGPLPAGEGGLPLGPDSKPVDPAEIAPPEERAEIEAVRSGAGLSRASDDIDLASAGIRPNAEASSSLPTPIVVLLVVTALGALTGLLLRARELVVRRPNG
jgi:hypothetical protein